jgi:hypothetical protein
VTLSRTRDTDTPIDAFSNPLNNLSDQVDDITARLLSEKDEIEPSRVVASAELAAKFSANSTPKNDDGAAYNAPEENNTPLAIVETGLRDLALGTTDEINELAKSDELPKAKSSSSLSDALNW